MNNLQGVFGFFGKVETANVMEKSPVIISRKERSNGKAFIYLNILDGGVVDLEITSKFLDGSKYFPGPTQKVETEVPAHIGEYLQKRFLGQEIIAPEDFNDFLETIWGTFVFGQGSWKD